MNLTTAPPQAVQDFLTTRAAASAPGRSLLREISRLPDLAKMTKEQTNALVEVARGADEALAADARDILVRRLLPIVGHAIAKLDIKSATDREDAHQAAMVRTLSCIARFDPAAGMSLPTYVYGSAQHAAVNWLQRERGEMYGCSESGRERFPARSLDDDDSLTLAAVLAVDNRDDPAEVAVQSCQADALRREVDRLPPREREVMILCYGLGGGAPPLTMDGIGQILGVSSTRVGVIAAGALEMLRSDAALERLGEPDRIHDKPPRSIDELATAALKDHHHQATSLSIPLSSSTERMVEEERHRHPEHTAALEADHPDGLALHLEQILSDRAATLREQRTEHLLAGAAAHRAAVMAMTLGAS